MKPRKIIFFLVICLFLLSFTSAEVFTFDNKVEYSEDLKTVTIINTLDLIGDKTILKAELKTPMVNVVETGYQRVAEIEINSYRDYNNFIGTLDFYNAYEYNEGNIKKLNRDYDLKYKTTEIYYTDYYVCPKVDNCYIDGLTEETREVWIPLEDFSLLKYQNLTIGIYTIASQGDYIEWIPELAGKEVDAWASFIVTSGSDQVVGAYTITTFTSAGYFNISSNLDCVEMLVIGSGGSGGGYAGGGSGAGGVLYNNCENLSSGNYLVAIGKTGWPTKGNNAGNNGGNTTFTGYVGVGGGGGGYYNVDTAKEGGSGGGGAGDFNGASGFVGQGNTGGTGDNSAPNYPGGGGGGAGTNGADATAEKPGFGGNGTAYNFNGTSVYYAGGGGGVSYDNDLPTTASLGGGGYGEGTQLTPDSANKRHGINGTGSGGSGGGTANDWSGNGGSGTVILKYLTPVTDEAPQVVLNSPENYYNASVSTVNFNTTVTDNLKVQNVSFFVDGVLDQTDTSNFNGTYIFTKALTTGLHNWSILAYDNASQSNQSGTLWVNITVISPTINLYAPEDNLETSNVFINFTGDVTDDFSIVNVSLYLNGTLTDLNTSGVKGVNYTFFKTLQEGIFTWYFKAYDNDSNPTDSVTRTLTIHTTEPNVTITSPSLLDNYISLPGNFSLNWSITEPGEDVSTHVTNCSYTYNGNTIYLSLNTCLSVNQTNVLYVNGINNISMNVTDFFNLTRSSYSDFSFKVVEINQTFSNTTIEGNTESYSAFIGLDSGVSISNVFFVYDGISYPASYSTVGSYVELEKDNFIVPAVTLDENKTLFWTVLLSDTSNINLSSHNQSVSNLLFGDCVTYPNVLFNITLEDEETGGRIDDLPNRSNGTIEANLKVMNRGRSIFLFNWTNITINAYTVSLCVNTPIPANVVYSVDGVIKYYAESVYAVEYYNLLNFTLTEGTQFQNITLRDLNLTDSTDFQLTFKDASDTPREDILIYVYREYVSEDEFKVVEVPITDSNGQTVLHLVRNDIVYNLVAVDIQGNVLGTLNNIIAFCEDFTIGNCEINFKAVSGLQDDLYLQLDDVGLIYSLNFDNVTNQIDLLFTSTNNEIKTVTLQAITQAIVTNRSVCNETLSAITGTLSCDISAYVSTTESVSVKIYVNGEMKVLEALNFNKDTWDLSGVAFVGFLLVLTLGIMFIESKEGIVIGVILGIVVLISLGVVKGGGLALASSVVWLIITGIIILIKLRRDN